MAFASPSLRILAPDESAAKSVSYHVAMPAETANRQAKAPANAQKAADTSTSDQETAYSGAQQRIDDAAFARLCFACILLMGMAFGLAFVLVGAWLAIRLVARFPGLVTFAEFLGIWSLVSIAAGAAWAAWRAWRR